MLVKCSVYLALLCGRLICWLRHLSQNVKLSVENDQHRLNHYVGLSVTKVGANICFSHAFGQLGRFDSIADSRGKICNEILEHEGNIAWNWNATVRLLNFLKLRFNLFKQHRRVILNKYLLN